jgi:hypothetical protein
MVYHLVVHFHYVSVSPENPTAKCAHNLQDTVDLLLLEAVGKHIAGHFIVHDPVVHCRYARVPAEDSATQRAYGFYLTMDFLYAKVVTRHPSQCCGTLVRVRL